MKKKTMISAALGGVFVFSILTYTMVDFFIEPKETRLPASVPSNYESLKACEKQEILWDKVKASVYKTLPEYRSLGFLQMLALGKQEISLKGSFHSDFAPKGWKKYLHGRGAIGKVKVVPVGNKYTGIFQGADCALLRLSLTSKVSGDRAVAPGLAFKVLRDGIYSANISALVSLTGQDHEYNFFKNAMSNIVPVADGIGPGWVHSIFSKVTAYPEELVVADMATINAQGITANNVVAPRQIFFEPAGGLKFSSTEHDVRNDFATIPAGTTIYHVRVVSNEHKDFNYLENYTAEKVEGFFKDSEHIADIVSTSEFVSSEFGDDGIFFRHQIRPKY
ncbi:hypothetical protein [Bdellovibrio sp. HCB337]|uniref:hypothetical protein n=1 Tax=Bdellovibrio sp. HCB337 TaxID=3394358 RepID=UPI0039A6A1C1